MLTMEEALELCSKAEGHMLMLIPITAESTAEDSMHFPQTLMLGLHQRAEPSEHHG